MNGTVDPLGLSEDKPELGWPLAAGTPSTYLAAAGTIAGNCQTAYVIALKIGLLPDGQRAGRPRGSST